MATEEKMITVYELELMKERREALETQNQGLLETLKDVLRDAKGYLRTHHLGPVGAQNIRRRIEAAHIAIAKAKRA